MKKIISILSKIVSFLVIVYVITVLPMLLNYHPLVVLSGSMEPTYKVGSLIYYKSRNNYKENDPITFSLHNNIVTHRIVKIIDNEYTTKGDANESPDLETITIDNIKGKVCRISIPYIGYYLKYLNDNTYLVIIMLMIISADILINKKGDIYVEE